jgi:hypothetical protein
VDWVDVAQDRDKSLAVVKTAVHILVPYDAANFMTSEGFFKRRTAAGRTVLFALTILHAWTQLHFHLRMHRIRDEGKIFHLHLEVYRRSIFLVPLFPNLCTR